MQAEIPFTWACRRSGRCCSAPGGFVWLQPGEVESMAAALGLEPEAFRAQHLRTVPDPRPGAQLGEMREALGELPDGRCTLLEGKNECRVYAARPEHCRSFPFWPSVLGDKQGFERARATCPGIAVRMEEEQRQQAFALFDELAQELEQSWEQQSGSCALSTVCSRPPETDQGHFVGGLEADWILARAGLPEGEMAHSHEDGGTCPWRATASGGGLRCTAAAGRPLACRAWASHTDPECLEARARETFQRLEELARHLGWPASYGRLHEQVASRLGIRGQAGQDGQ